jgi:hypothetical protein
MAPITGGFQSPTPRPGGTMAQGPMTDWYGDILRDALPSDLYQMIQPFLNASLSTQMSGAMKLMDQNDPYRYANMVAQSLGTPMGYASMQRAMPGIVGGLKNQTLRDPAQILRDTISGLSRGATSATSQIPSNIFY